MQSNKKYKAHPQLNELTNNFVIYQEIQNMLDDVAFTQNQAEDLANAIVQAVITLQQTQSQQEKKAVKQLFNKKMKKTILENQIYYYGILQSLRKKMKDVKQFSKSRIYHTIANINKQKSIQIQQNNSFGINCITSNAYNQLKSPQLQEVIKYEKISEDIRLLGGKINFKYQSIKQQSEKMFDLLSIHMVKHVDYLNNLKYNLQIDQVLKVAKISRKACNYYDNGVFVLLVYLVQSCKRLEKQNLTSQQINEKISQSIKEISIKYPPGQGLPQEKQHLKLQLKKLQLKEQKIFSHQYKMLEKSNKQGSVDKIIKQYAQIATDCRQLFQQFVRQICLQNCIQFKIGLKYHPNSSDVKEKKALTRIKEKMFFPKDAQISKEMVGSIQKVLEQQQNSYKENIDQLLKNTQKVQFKISDMLRGKCVYLEIEDIISTVNRIKEFVKEDKRFSIKQIQNRFTNKVPLSDVTLKIVVKKKIVAELQLTVQNNAATYNFAHKIYELNRSKVFSKLAITHNYYKQFNSEFSQLASKAFVLVTSKIGLKKEVKTKIWNYFNLESKFKPFSRLVSEALQQKQEQREKKIPKLVISVDPLLQDLMLGIFKISMKVWYKPLGSVLNPILKQEQNSSILKSVLLSHFFETFKLPKEVEFMQQLGITQESLKTKVYISEYIRNYFHIENVSLYTMQNQRIFCRYHQLEQVKFYKTLQTSPIILDKIKFVKNIVIEDSALQNILKLREMLNFYFTIRNQQYQINNNQQYQQDSNQQHEDDSDKDKFASYYSWMDFQLQQNIDDEVDKELFASDMKLIEAQYLLQQGRPKKALKTLQAAKKIYKDKQKHNKAINCEILLTQCFIKTSYNKKQKYQYYQEVVKKLTLLLTYQLKGVLYADSLQRVCDFLWKKKQKQQDYLDLLQQMTALALNQMSKYRGKQFIYGMCKWYKKLKTKKAEKIFKIFENDNIIYIKLTDLNAQDCELLIKAKWENLTQLNLENNQISDEGCKYLSESNWENLTHLNLKGNKIGNDGCKHLKKAKWNQLKHLHLQSNVIQDDGCEFLTKMNWNLISLNISSNKIKDQSCEYIAKAKWTKLKILDISSNSIGDLGCKYLSQVQGKNWKNLTFLNICNTKFGKKGQTHLEKGKKNWKKCNIIMNDNQQQYQESSAYISDDSQQESQT